MVFGDIHDLLRKVNGESEPAYMWQSDKQGKEVRTEEPSAVKEEQAREPDEKPDKESRQETSEEASAIAKPEKVPKAKEGSTSQGKVPLLCLETCQGERRGNILKSQGK
jgi:hypothetical protein